LSSHRFSSRFPRKNHRFRSIAFTCIDWARRPNIPESTFLFDQAMVFPHRQDSPYSIIDPRLSPSEHCQDALFYPLEDLQFATFFKLVFGTDVMPNIFRRRAPRRDFAQPNFWLCL
jgi:hypothetical protein